MKSEKSRVWPNRAKAARRINRCPDCGRNLVDLVRHRIDKHNWKPDAKTRAKLISGLAEKLK